MGVRFPHPDPNSPAGSKGKAVQVGKIKLFSGNANQPLAKAISNYLGIPLGRASVKRFADGEVFAQIDENVRNMDVFIVQPTCAPVNDAVMELLIIMDAVRRASANSITAVIPYYGYARQDRKVLPRTPISAKLVADLLQTAGADRVLAMDLHAGQIQGFFNVPVDNVFATPVLLREITNQKLADIMIVSPDAGGTERARAIAKRLDAQLAIIDKRRPMPNVAEIVNVIGDVQGKDAVIIDDMIDTAGTLCAAAQVLMEKGARSVYAAATHGIFSPPAFERIEKSVLTKVMITDTIPLAPAGLNSSKIVQLSVSELLGEAIKRIYYGESLSQLFV